MYNTIGIISWSYYETILNTMIADMPMQSSYRTMDSIGIEIHQSKL